jgi:flavodoxin
MKTLVAYYSRTGNTEKVAKEIAKELNADVEKILCPDYNGMMGFLKAGKEAMKKKKPEISFGKNPLNYDLVIIGWPVWAGNMCSPVRSFISNYNLKDVKHLGFFCTKGGENGNNGISEIIEVIGKKGASLVILAKDIKNSDHFHKIKEFCKGLK